MAIRLGPTASRSTTVALAAQIVLLSAMGLLVATSRWLADPVGVVMLVLGAFGIGLGGVVWQRLASIWLLVAADMWFILFGLAIAGPPPCADGCDLGPAELVPWQFITGLGGPLTLVSLIWMVAGSVGILALLRSSIRRG